MSQPEFQFIETFSGSKLDKNMQEHCISGVYIMFLFHPKGYIPEQNGDTATNESSRCDVKKRKFSIKFVAAESWDGSEGELLKKVTEVPQLLLI